MKKRLSLHLQEKKRKKSPHLLTVASRLRHKWCPANARIKNHYQSQQLRLKIDKRAHEDMTIMIISFFMVALYISLHIFQCFDKLVVLMIRLKRSFELNHSVLFFHGFLIANSVKRRNVSSVSTLKQSRLGYKLLERVM